MQTRSKTAKSMLTNIPDDVMLLVLTHLSLQQQITFSRTCNWARKHVLDNLKALTAMGDLPVEGLTYAVKYCKNLVRPPHLTGQSSDSSFLHLLATRCPQEMLLQWNVFDPWAMSSFLDSPTLKGLQHLNLSIPSLIEFNATRINFHYLDLRSLTIEAESVCLRTILVCLNCRSWDVEKISLRGDVQSLTDLLMYLPNVDRSFCLTNTSDMYTHCDDQDLFTGINYLVNAGIDVRLSNVVQICCHPPAVCGCSKCFVDAVEFATFHGGFKACWTMDRMTCSMIEALLKAHFFVHTGIYAVEMHQVQALSDVYTDMVKIKSVF